MSANVPIRHICKQRSTDTEYGSLSRKSIASGSIHPPYAVRKEIFL